MTDPDRDLTEGNTMTQPTLADLAHRCREKAQMLRESADIDRKQAADWQALSDLVHGASLAAGSGLALQLAEAAEHLVASWTGHETDMAQLRDLAARVAALQAELAACRAAGREARAAEQHRHDTAASKEAP